MDIDELQARLHAIGVDVSQAMLRRWGTINEESSRDLNGTNTGLAAEKAVELRRGAKKRSSKRLRCGSC